MDMGRNQRRTALPQMAAQHGREKPDRGRIQRHRGLIEQPDRATGDQQPGQTQPALLPRRQGMGRTARQTGQIHRGQRGLDPRSAKDL